MQDKTHNHFFSWIIMLSLILFTEIYLIIIILLTNYIVYKNSIVWIILSLSKFLKKNGGVTNGSA